MMSKDKKNKPDEARAQALLLDRINALEQALAIHENRLNNLNIPLETVNTMSIQTLRMLGQMLLAVTEPQRQDSPQPIEEAQPEAAAIAEGG